MAQVTDPVCGMKFAHEDAFATEEYKCRVYYFCSADCKETFAEDKDSYVDEP